MDKVKNKKGEIAVLISRGFGAGWYSWNDQIEIEGFDPKELLFHPKLVALVNAKKPVTEEDIAEIFGEEEAEEGYWGAGSELSIVWVNENSSFKVTEYDGAESLQYRDNTDWVVA